MANIRSGNMKVSRMKDEITKRLAVLAVGYNPKKCNPRVKRQLEQGYNFLDMISKPPYRYCTTISSLIEKIKEQRDGLQARVLALDTHMPGHQFSLFEKPQDVTPEQQDEIAKEQMWLEQEIKWLHKCMGMCKNRDYFK
ncbi:MAG: hypothetical protein IJ272_05375 [Clostridia bacterium]|nr:hypothetical protein [Clostridia bacterium]